MKWILLLVSCCSFTATCCSQNDPRILDPSFARKLQSLLKHSVPELACEQLFKNQGDYIILDTRSNEEYLISHIENAIRVDYNVDHTSLPGNIDFKKKIVCYCSVGYRSEILATKLKSAGFTNVYNLYGGIFEWINQDFPVYDDTCMLVKKIHTYNRNWSRWVNNPNYSEIY